MTSDSTDLQKKKQETLPETAPNETDSAAYETPGRLMVRRFFREKTAVAGLVFVILLILAAVKCEGVKLGIPEDANADYFYRMNERYKQNPPPVKSPLFSMHPYRAFNVWKNARRFTDRELVMAFRELVKANRAIVSSAGNARIALELLTVKIAES